MPFQAAQQQLQQQLAAQEQLAAEVEQLKTENLEAWKLKYELEGQMAAYKASLEGLQRQGSCMHKVRGSLYVVGERRGTQVGSMQRPSRN